MEIMRNRYLILIAVILFTSILVNFLSYDTYHKAEAGLQAVKSIPLEIGRWQGKDIPIENLVYEILETKSIIQRTYTSNAQEVFLSIVYYPETKVDFHAPEGCLGGQGIQIDKSAKNIDIINDGKKVKIKLSQLIWQREGKESLVYYFYKAGEFIGQDYIKLRLNLAINKFSNNKEKSGSLIRFSTPILSGDIQKASNILSGFLNELYPFLIKYL
jgi:EpsI family protein